MHWLLLQTASEGGFHVDTTWVIGTLIGVIGILWGVIIAMARYIVTEGRRKDQLIDRLLRTTGKSADVTERSVSLAEREHGRGARH